MSNGKGGRGGCHEWYQTISLDFVDVSAKFVFLFRASKQNCGVPFTNHGYPGMLQSAICIIVEWSALGSHF